MDRLNYGFVSSKQLKGTEFSSIAMSVALLEAGTNAIGLTNSKCEERDSKLGEEDVGFPIVLTLASVP